MPNKPRYRYVHVDGPFDSFYVVEQLFENDQNTWWVELENTKANEKKEARQYLINSVTIRTPLEEFEL